MKIRFIKDKNPFKVGDVIDLTETTAQGYVDNQEAELLTDENKVDKISPTKSDQ